MCTIKVMIYPDWMVKAMQDHGLTWEDGNDLKKLESILSVRDLVIYSSINSLHFHDVIESVLCSLKGVQPGFSLEDIQPFFMSNERADGANQLSYHELVSQVYDPEIEGDRLVDLVCAESAKGVRLWPEAVIGNTVHVSILPTNIDRNDAIAQSLEALVKIINDETPITMETTALFDLYIQHRLQHAA